MTATLPEKQHAVQLVGPGELKLNPAKAVTRPGPYEILIKVEACGLCFSDLKLLKQFSGHARKSEVIGGLSPDVLNGIQSYVPGEKPVVPGHEVVCRIVAVGSSVKHHKVGERCLVQTDYRDLPTASSNAAFGYNFEGGLQEYCIVDERVAIDSKGDRFLIPVGEEKSASAVALVEPWACVEDSYVNRERQTIKSGGKTLVVVEPGHKQEGVTAGQVVEPSKVAALPNEGFDDIIYFGANKATIEILNDKLAPRGLMNIVLGGTKIGAKVNTGVGRVHYGMTRWVGTTGTNAMESYKTIPATTEIRPNDKIIVIGAGGPMGQMHIIRNICSGVKGISQVGTDMDDPRLNSLGAKANALAEANKAPLKLINTARQKITDKFTYWALMAPVAALVEEAIQGSLPGAIINIFAGIPAPTKHELDLDTYIERKLYMFGTSGSVIEDMKIVLKKVETGQLDTNTSLDAISGMAGATDGIKAIENRTLAGKIVVYPMLHDVPLIPLAQLDKHFPTVAAKLTNGQWNKQAEQELLKVAAGKQPMNPDLKDQVALVTGAGRGIGRSIAMALARCSAHVWLAARTESELSSVADEISRAGGRATAVPCDLSDESQIERMFRQIPRLDILINNAGVGLFGRVAELSTSDLDQTLSINVRGPFLCCREALNLMIPAKSGYIINIASVVGFKGYLNQAAYGASKHAVMGLTKSLAVECQPHNIRVSALLPGGVDAGMSAAARPDLARDVLISPDDVANTVLFLLSLGPTNAAIDQIYIRRKTSQPF